MLPLPEVQRVTQCQHGVSCCEALYAGAPVSGTLQQQAATPTAAEVITPHPLLNQYAAIVCSTSSAELLPASIVLRKDFGEGCFYDTFTAFLSCTGQWRDHGN